MNSEERRPTPIRWIPVINTESEPCPAFAACEPKGIDEDTGLLKIGKPTTAGSTAVFFNSGTPIPGSETVDGELVYHQGQVHASLPCLAAYQPGEEMVAPAHDEVWGTQNDSWYLHKDETGFRVVGDGATGVCNILLDTAGEKFVTGILASGFHVNTSGHIRAKSEPGASVPGNTRGHGAVEWQQARFDADHIASGDWSAIVGGQDVTASGSGSVAGGTSTFASGGNAVCFGDDNEASGNYSVICGGRQCVASGRGAFIGAVADSGGEASGDGSFIGAATGSTASGDFSAVLVGTDNVASGIGSVILNGGSNAVSGAGGICGGGSSHNVSGAGAVAFGSSHLAVGRSGFATGERASARLWGMKAHASGTFISGASGDAQVTDAVLRNATTNATPTILYMDGQSGSNEYTIPSGVMIAATIRIAANGSGGQAHYLRQVTATQSGILGSVTTLGTDYESNAAYDVSITVTSNTLRITVTGDTGNNLHWVAHVEAIEVR